MSLCSAVGFFELNSKGCQRNDFVYLWIDLLFARHMGWLGYQNLRAAPNQNMKSYSEKMFSHLGPYKVHHLSIGRRDDKKYSLKLLDVLPCC